MATKVFNNAAATISDTLASVYTASTTAILSSVYISDLATGPGGETLVSVYVNRGSGDEVLFENVPISKSDVYVHPTKIYLDSGDIVKVIADIDAQTNIYLAILELS